MIQFVNILTKDGKSLLFRNYSNIDIDRDLLAGFLGAFSSFIKENSQGNIERTQTENFKYFYTIIDTIIIVVCTDLEDEDAIINSRILSIRTRFLKKYGEILRSGSWTGNQTIFSEFGKELDNVLLGAIKVSIIGFGDSGKSDIIKLICGRGVDLEYVPTITVDIAEYDGEEFGRTLTLWDFAGQEQYRSLWRSLLEQTDIVLLVTESTFENINASRAIIHDILDIFYQDKLVIGIANKQNLPDRLTPEFCERILSTERREIITFGMDATDPRYREKIIAILKEAIEVVSKPENRISSHLQNLRELKLEYQWLQPVLEEKVIKKVKTLNERRCYNCKCKLHFDEAYRQNKHISLSDFKKIWNSEYVELYCCICYRTPFNLRYIEPRAIRVLRNIIDTRLLREVNAEQNPMWLGIQTIREVYDFQNTGKFSIALRLYEATIKFKLLRRTRRRRRSRRNTNYLR